MTDSSADEPELQLITDSILAKDSSDRLLEVIQNGPVFVQAILNRTKKSLEHLKVSVDRYRKVFDELFTGLDGQEQIVDKVYEFYVIKAAKGQASTDNDEGEKMLKVLQKLCQINCISNQAVISWAIKSLKT